MERPGVARSAAVAVALAVAGCVALVGVDAQADAPRDALRTALEKSRQARSVHVDAQEQSRGGSSRGTASSARVEADLAAADSDLSVTVPQATTRTVSVGGKVYQKGPGAATWVVKAAPPPSARPTTAATPPRGPLEATFPDGRSLGDQRLYRAVTEQPVAVTAAAGTRTLVAELDMAEVATALQARASERARVAQWQGTLTVTVAPDGRVARQQLALRGSSSGGPEPYTVDLDLTYSRYDAVTVTPPVRP